LYVTGYIPNVLGTDLLTQPLNHSDIFESDIVVTNDAWHTAVNFNMNTYQEVITTIRLDILVVERQKKEFTPIAELKQTETLLQTSETNLSNFYQFLPRLDRRRALVDFGGTALKFLFRTATQTDVRSLHSALNELHSKNSDIVHSLSQQITYIKQLNTITRIQMLSLICQISSRTI
jgi:hypothetical protein